MRKIIFRAWSNVYNEYSDVPWAAMSLDGYGNLIVDENFIAEQWTGVKDKFGTLIFEGDIVKYECGTKAEVIFKEGCFMAYNGYAISSDEAYFKICPEYNPIDGYEFDIQVIGNIHQMRIL